MFDIPPLSPQDLAKLTDDEQAEYLQHLEALYWDKGRTSFREFIARVETPGAPMNEPEPEVYYPQQLVPAAPHLLFVDAIQGLVDGSDAGVDGVLAMCPPGTAKPLDGNTRVLMASGVWQKLSSVRVGDRVIGKSGRSCLVSAVHHQGTLPCVLIRTNAGREIIAEPSHPLMSADGWREAGSLVEGDVLALMADAQCNRSETDTEQDIARAALAGYLLGDGCHSFV
jgi:hypothetical protein